VLETAVGDGTQEFRLQKEVLERGCVDRAVAIRRRLGLLGLGARVQRLLLLLLQLSIRVISKLVNVERLGHFAG
jgi:hypothetical protein